VRPPFGSVGNVIGGVASPGNGVVGVGAVGGYPVVGGIASPNGK
jgi:hypothetical protein